MTKFIKLKAEGEVYQLTEEDLDQVYVALQSMTGVTSVDMCSSDADNHAVFLVGFCK